MPVDNRKLVMGFGGAVAALLFILVLAAVYAFVIHKPDTMDAQLAEPRNHHVTTEAETTSEESLRLTGVGAAAGCRCNVDGPLTFSGVRRRAAARSPTRSNDCSPRTPAGEFIVVRLTVQNTSPDPGQLLGTLQKLKAAGQVYSIDDEATSYVGGGLVDVPPGGQVEVGLAYDVPPGTVPETIELHADPVSPGVELPVA